MRRALLGLLVASPLGGCTAFEDPTIVLDLRVLAMSATLLGDAAYGPEQVIDIDPQMPLTPRDLRDALEPTQVCALVADPGQQRDLRWSMRLCLLDDESRCDRARPYVELGSGVIADPDSSTAGQYPCATIFPDDSFTGNTLAAMMIDALDEDPVQALGGIEYSVELRIGGVEADPALDVFATKHLRVAARIPFARRANQNPAIEFLDAAEGGVGITIPRAHLRCANALDFGIVPQVDGGSVVTLFPVEPEGVREEYVVPTLDGQEAVLTETVSYQWLAAYGDFSDAFTGGGHDILGNQSLLGTEWRAPQVSSPALVPIWMIQRDERYGVTWLETCVRVVP